MLPAVSSGILHVDPRPEVEDVSTPMVTIPSAAQGKPDEDLPNNKLALPKFDNSDISDDDLNNYPQLLT